MDPFWNRQGESHSVFFEEKQTTLRRVFSNLKGFKVLQLYVNATPFLAICRVFLCAPINICLG